MTDQIQLGQDELSLSERIRRALPELPRAERQVGRALLLYSPTIGLESSLRLAEIVGTSGATVIRFVNRLGFSTYSDFQREWRAALDARLVTPSETYREYQRETNAVHRVMRSAATASESIQKTISQLPEAELDTAVKLLVERRRVFCFGGWFSHVLARHMVALLQGIRPGVALLEQDPGTRSAALVDTTRQDMAVVFDFRRYEQPTLVASQHLASRKAPVVLITDQWISPIAGFANAVLIARTDPDATLQRLASAMVVVEALVSGVADELDATLGQRIEKLGEVSSKLIPNWGDRGG